MDMGDRIKELRILKGFTQEELGKILGVKKAAVQKYESGEVENLKRSTIKLLADTLEVSPSYLMGWEDDNQKYSNIMRIETKKIPLLGRIAAGVPIFADEQFESYVEAGTNIHVDFCLRVQGDSMINARICDGDIVFIRKQPDVNDGEIAAVLIDDEATLKRVYKMPGRIQLRAENPKYQPMNFTQDNCNSIIILGKAVAFQSDVK